MDAHMKRVKLAFTLFLITGPTILQQEVSANEAKTTEQLYQKHCANCHGADRLGGIGPALLPDNLGRLKKEAAIGVILNGRPANQMPAFRDRLAQVEADALAGFIYTAPAQMPRWGLEEIRASRVVHNKPESLPAKLQFKADPLNLFIVVEAGDHHATLLDGDKFEPILRFPTRFALHGGPKFSPDGRFVYFGSRDGWVSKFDIYNLKWVAEVRAGINMRNVAVSSDGRFVIAGNYLPHTLVVLDSRDLTPLKVIEAKNDADESSRVSAVYDAAPRKSFIAALKDIAEVWEIPYEGKGEDSGEFAVRRIKLDDYLDDFFFDQDYNNLIGTSRDGRNGQVVNLVLGRKIADVDLLGMPHLGSGITWQYNGHPVLASPNLKEGTVSVIDMKDWKKVKEIKTLGPGFFLRSHEETPYAWVDASMSPNKDTIQVIDKRSLEVVKAIRPEPGKTVAHVEFTRDGKYALVSIWEMDGALVVYDAATFKEVKRLPMKKPSGKYNVSNKITRSTGTSH